MDMGDSQDDVSKDLGSHEQQHMRRCYHHAVVGCCCHHFLQRV